MAKLKKIDFKKTMKALYAPPTDRFETIDVQPMTFVQIDGAGDPNCAQAYADAVKAIYTVSYALKFDAKNTLGKDYVVPPLEGLWWADDPTAFIAQRRDEWKWTMMIMAPDFVTQDMYQAAVQKAEAKLGPLPASLRFEVFHEGHSLQKLHIGSYASEAPVLLHLHDKVMPARGVTFNGPHHEIYLSDPRKTDAAKLKTVLRQPIRPLSLTA